MNFDPPVWWYEKPEEKIMSCEIKDMIYEEAYDLCCEELEREPTEQEWEEMFQKIVEERDWFPEPDYYEDE